MTPQTQRHTEPNPWDGKGDRFWFIASLACVACITFAAYDGSRFYVRYMELCTAQPDRAECRPLNLTKEVRPPDPGVTMYYDKGKWSLDVGTRLDDGQARELASRLMSYGIESRAIKVSGRSKTVRFQVQIGRFPSRKIAVEAGTQLQSKGIIQTFSASSYQTAK